MRFRLFQKKSTPPAEEAPQEPEVTVEQMVREPVKVEKEKVDISNDRARIEYLGRLHEGILEAKRQCGEIKFEYGQVPSYLKDIQLIDQAPEEEKEEMYTAAQKRAMENYEPSVEEDIRKLLEYEEYQVKIKNDLRQLSSEKNLLLADKRDIIRGQRTLKTIGKCLTAILIALGAMLAALYYCFRVDITFPFLATVAFGFIIAAIILNEAKKNRMDMVITEKKCNRAIFLSNRVKIKYVNNVRTLDYLYHKYQVRNATELDFVFGQYRKAKREWAKQRESSIRINENNQILMSELQRLGVKDRDIWFAQAKALINPKEMVEVRHDLNVRRQKLREQLDYNTGIMEECLEEMEKIRDKKPEYAVEVERILSQEMQVK